MGARRLRLRERERAGDAARGGGGAAPPAALSQPRAAAVGGGSPAPAQALAQRVDEQTSLQMTRQLLRLSLYNIAYGRALFPARCFAEREVRELDSMRVQVIRPGSDPEAGRLLEWMEKGAFDALQRRYLRRLKFALSEDAAGTRLLEEYSFTFAYSAGGDVRLEIERGGSPQAAAVRAVARAEAPTAKEVKQQICMITRLLVSLMGTLDTVPAERHLQMELFYYDERTPEDYEPPFFAANRAPGRFSATPFAVDIGRAQTTFHAVGIRVKSALVAGDVLNRDDDDCAAAGAPLARDAAGVPAQRPPAASPAELASQAAALSSGQLALERLDQLTLTLGAESEDAGLAAVSGGGGALQGATLAPRGTSVRRALRPRHAAPALAPASAAAVSPTWSDAETMSLQVSPTPAHVAGDCCTGRPSAAEQKSVPAADGNDVRRPSAQTARGTVREVATDGAPALFQSQETALSGKNRRKSSKALGKAAKQRRIALQVA